MKDLINTLTRDLCSMEARSKSKTREILTKTFEQIDLQHEKAIEMIQAKIDRNDNKPLKAGLLYALTVLQCKPEQVNK